MEKLFVNIRKAEPADIGGIASIYEQAVLLGTASFEVTPPSEEEMLSRMQTIEAGHYPYLVAELEHQILGFAPTPVSTAQERLIATRWKTQFMFIRNAAD